MFGYKVDIEQYCDHNERSDEDYGSWSSSFTHSLSDIVRKTNEYPDIVSSLDIAPGTRAPVVWAVWSTCDSFGRSSGSGTEAFGIFTDIKKAVSALESLPPEPFGQMMTEAGMPPDAGYELHLPFLLKDHFPFAPSYVKFSRAVHKPTILPSLIIGTFKYA